MSEFKVHHLVSELFNALELPEKDNEHFSARYFSKHLLDNRTPNISSKISPTDALRKIGEKTEEPEKIKRLYEIIKSKNVREADSFVYLLGCIATDENTKQMIKPKPESFDNKGVSRGEVSQLIDKLQNVAKNQRPNYQSAKEIVIKKHSIRNCPQLPSWSKNRSFQSWNFSPSNTLERNDLGQIGILPIKAQESLLIEDLLFCMNGLEGNYIGSKQSGQEIVELYIKDQTTDPSLKEFAKRIFPICQYYSIIIKFVEEKSRYECGLVNHALASAYRVLLKDYFVLIAQLEYQKSKQQFSLQKFWFFIQPMLQVMEVLATIATSINMSQAFGGNVLTILHEQTSSMTGRPKAQEIALLLTQASCVPYFDILELWIYKGIISDPYSEFFVEDNEHGKKDEISHNYSDDYWEKRYKVCRQRIPIFLEGVAEMILRTGKYLNVIRQCSDAINNSHVETVVYTMSERLYVEKIETAYKFASQQLLDLLMKNSDLLGRLRSFKHYFLMDQGDFIVQFLDMAEEELKKDINDIMPSRLESLVELALRTSVVNSDRYKDDVRVELFPNDLLSQMFKILRMPNEQREESVNDAPICGLEAFAFDYDVQWPLSLVLGRKVIACYQMLFRQLLYCKHVERMLGKVWLLNNSSKSGLLKTATYATAFALRQRMVNFIQNLEYYMMFEVIEPNWLSFLKKIHDVNNVDEVLSCHSDFIDGCLKDCMLTQPELLQTIRKLLKFCVNFAEYMLSAHSNNMDNSLLFVETNIESLTQEQIESYQEEFTQSLLSLLSMISNHGQDNCNDKMVNMLYRLDLNGFYSKNYA